MGNMLKWIFAGRELTPFRQTPLLRLMDSVCLKYTVINGVQTIGAGLTALEVSFCHSPAGHGVCSRRAKRTVVL